MPLIARSVVARRWRRGAVALLVALAACVPGARGAPAAPPPAGRPAAPLPEPPSEPSREPSPARPPVVPPTAGAVHYVEQVLAAHEGRVVRWDRGPDRPLRVWVPPAPADPRTAGFVALVDSALAAWNGVGLPVVLARATDPAHADVLLRWVRTEREAETAGRTRLGIDGRTDHVTAATLALTTHATSGYAHPPAVMLGVALHELGHVLGLQHGGTPDCVMFPIPQRTALCAADAETARRWYAMPATVTAAAGHGQLPRK